MDEQVSIHFIHIEKFSPGVKLDLSFKPIELYSSLPYEHVFSFPLPKYANFHLCLLKTV